MNRMLSNFFHAVIPLLLCSLAICPVRAGLSVFVSDDSLSAAVDERGLLRSWTIEAYKDELLDPSLALVVPPSILEAHGGKVPPEWNFTGAVGFGVGTLPWEKKNLLVVDGAVSTESGGGYSVLYRGRGEFEGLKISVKASRVATFMINYHLRIENEASKPVALGTDGARLGFWTFCPLTMSSYYTEPVGGEDSSAARLSAKSAPGVASQDKQVKWVGVRDNYYLFAMREKKGLVNYFASAVRVSRRRKGEGYTPLELFNRLLDRLLWRGGAREQLASYMVGAMLPYPAIRKGEIFELEFDVYFGPKASSFLPAVFKSADNTFSGLTGAIGRVLFSVLKALHSITGNWGASILLLTVLVKMLLFPLSRKQQIASRKLQEMQPKIQAVRERFKNNQDRMNKELQKLFLEEGANPLAPCLPILLQIPIFFAIYACLSSCIELRKVSFLWLPDLGGPDPYLILPLAMCLSMYWSTRNNMPQQGADPTSQFMMRFMPVFLFFVMRNLASGVMLYIVGQSLFSTLEAWYIRKFHFEGGSGERR